MSDQSPHLDEEIFLEYAPKCSLCGRILNKEHNKLGGDVEYIEWIKPESTGLRIYLNKDAE